MVFGKAFNLDGFALFQFGCRPRQGINPLIGLLTVGIINMTILFQRAVIAFAQVFNGQHDVFTKVWTILRLWIQLLQGSIEFSASKMVT